MGLYFGRLESGEGGTEEAGTFFKKKAPLESGAHDLNFIKVRD